MGADHFKEKTFGIKTFPIETFKIKYSDAHQILRIKSFSKFTLEL